MNKYSGSLFYLSRLNLDNKILKSGFLMKNAVTHFHTDIDGALVAINIMMKPRTYYVHKAVGNIVVNIPTLYEAPNRVITHERWVVGKVKVKCIGKIKVDKNGWKWVEQYD